MAEASSVEPAEEERSQQLSAPDIRNLWTTTSLSQLNPAERLPDIYGEALAQRSPLSSGPSSPVESDWEARAGELGSFTDSDLERLDEHTRHQLLMRIRRGSSLSEHVGGEHPRPGAVRSSTSVSEIPKHTHHQAYFVEQSNRLPLPLVELMENEALDILYNAFQSYKNWIGVGHFLTLELQQQILELCKRRNKKPPRFE